MNLTHREGRQFVSDALVRSPRLFVWISVLLALILLAGFALLASLILSLEILEFSIKIPWAALVSSYTWLVVAGSGLCIINALGAVFGLPRYEMMAKRIVFLSLTSIIFGMTFILMHLGRPERIMIYNLISPNFRSAISWMGALYNVYLGIVVFELWLLLRNDFAHRAQNYQGLTGTIFSLIALKKLNGSRLGNILADHRLPRLVGTLAFGTGIAALTMLGSVFAHAESRTLWYGPYYPIYFLLSALFLGYALLLTVTIISYHFNGEEMTAQLKNLIFEMAQILAFLLALGLCFAAFRLATGIIDPMRQGPLMLVLNGAFAFYFWVFEIGLMSVIPIVILLGAAIKQSLKGVLTGSLMVLIGSFVMRYIFMVAGQVYPNISEGLPSYLPTLMEMMVIGGILGMFLLVYTLGEKFLPIKENISRPEH